MMILIGSRALEIVHDDFRAGVNSDYDIVYDPESETKFEWPDKRIEWHNINDLNNRDISTRFKSDHKIEFNNTIIEVCSLRGLSLIKRSHLWRDQFFNKHIMMYHKFMMNSSKSKLSELERDFLETRTKLTKEAEKRYSNPNLNQSNDDFFDDAVEKKYDHDWIHEIVAYGSEPMYMKMKRDFSKAWCEKDMWDNFTHEEKCKTVAEETYVISCERFLIPEDWPNKHMRYYDFALKKVCTTLTSGWFRDFAIDNYEDIRALFSKEKFIEIERMIKNEF